VDDYSLFTWVFFLQEKSQTQETLKRFLRWTQNEFGLRIKKIRSDNGTEFKNSQIESSISSLLPTHLNKMVLWRERIELSWIWQGPCLMSTRHRIGFGRRQFTPLATPSTTYTYTESSRKHRMNSSLVKSLMFLILEFLGENALFLLREVEILNLLLKQ
jgi:hypothetical protein